MDFEWSRDAGDVHTMYHKGETVAHLIPDMTPGWRGGYMSIVEDDFQPSNMDSHHYPSLSAGKEGLEWWAEHQAIPQRHQKQEQSNERAARQLGERRDREKSQGRDFGR